MEAGATPSSLTVFSFPWLRFTASALLSLLLLQLALSPRAAPSLADASRPPPPPRPPSGTLRVALLGDSITLGQMCNSGGYGKYLAPALGARHYQLASFANNGLSMLRFNPFVLTQLWTDARAFDAEVYIVLLGTNDASPAWWDEAAYVEVYGAMLATLRAQPAAPIVFVVAPPPYFSSQIPGFPNNVSVLNEVLPLRTLPAFCAAQGAPLINVFSALGGGNLSGFPVEKYFCDGIHPWPAGSELIARVVYKALWQRLVVEGGWPRFEMGEAFFEGLVAR